MDKPGLKKPGQAEGYRNTRFNRWKTRLQIAISERIPSRRHSNASILYLSSTRLVKYGRTVHLAEAAALQFLAAHSSQIPVPKLYCAFRDDKTGESYIVMERMAGQPLSDTWAEASKGDNGPLFAQLKVIFDALRALEKPAGLADGAVCAADGGKLHDYRIHNGGGQKGMGPFADEAAFHLFIRNGIDEVDPPVDTKVKADLKKLVDAHKEWEARKLGTVFTHGDISPSNILVNGGKVVGVIDWEMSGWFPRYWEYTTAIGGFYGTKWKEAIQHFVDPWPQEEESDDIWKTYYCDNPRI